MAILGRRIRRAVLWLCACVAAIAAADGACPVIAQPVVSGGCVLTLTTASNCQTLDATATGYYEFAWSTGGTFCESPVKILIAGSPTSSFLSGSNYIVYTVSSGTGAGGWSWLDRSIGGYIHLSPQDLAPLTSDNGQYFWGLQSYYGSTSGMGTFTLRAASATSASDTERLFNWAESIYPSLFPKSAAATTQTYLTYTYRYYPASGLYLATANGRVIVHGGAYNLLDVGAVSSYLPLAAAAGF